MIWLRCVFIAAGVVLSAVALACEYNKWRKNQTAITQGHTYNTPIEGESKCGICLKELKPSEAIVLPCKHTFCSTCLKPLFHGTQKSCCDCRKEISPYDLDVLKLKLNKLD